MKTTITILAILIAIGFVLGSIRKDIGAQAEPCPTLSQSLKAKCNCPDPIIYEIGCTDGIDGATTIKIDGASNLIIDNKEFSVSDIKKDISPISL